MSINLPALTLHHVLENSATNFADNFALSFIGEQPITYKELYESVKSLSHWLSEQGIGFGDTVAILAENCPHWGIAYLAITSMGAVAVPILIEFHPDAVSHIIRHSEAKLVFVSEKLFSKVADANVDPTVTFVNLESFLPMEQGMTKDKVRDLKSVGLREFRKWRDKAKRMAKFVPEQPAEDDLAAIVYTSGTTGHSKGVMLTHKNIVSDVISVRSIALLSQTDRMLSILPLAHTLECTLGFITPLMHGAQVFYLDKPPTARVLLPALAKVKPTVFLAVPLIIEKIYKNTILPKLTSNWLTKRLYTIPFFRKILHKAAAKKLMAIFGNEVWIMAIGGAPLASDAERFLKEGNFPYAIGYGLTECSPLVAASPAESTVLLSTGFAIPNVSIRVADINPITGEGELQVKGPNIMKGYYKAPDITAEVFTPDGWFRTGDLGYIDDNNYVFIKGRSKNMVLGPSGENIYPEEIESIFFASPYVAEVLVFQHNGVLAARVHINNDVFDEHYHSLGAVEALQKRTEILEAMRLEVNSKVSNFAKVHKIFEQTEPFEKTPTHKIKRYLYINAD